MITIHLTEGLKARIPDLVLSCIACDVTVQEESAGLWDEISKKVDEVALSMKVEDISRIPAIAASRLGYKACGKDPARYRLSAEALLRRVVQGKGLYRVNNAVDLLNLVSLSSGYSIGGYDAEKIAGDVIFGIGQRNEPYEGIGRGDFNIENLPVFRDSIGAFGTPTSDSVRTMVTPVTRRFLMVIIDFGFPGELDNATALAVSLLKRFAFAEQVEINTIKN
jgi:DNA/RNA-binding domain of Phe-tRNA-synthetase-like protein